MIIRCIETNSLQLPEEYIARHKGDNFFLKKEQIYDVYGIFIWNYRFYYLIDDGVFSFPAMCPAPFFEIINRKLSKYWELYLKKGGSEPEIMFTFYEWGTNSMFYHNLVDGKEIEVNTFNKYKQLINSENDRT